MSYDKRELFEDNDISEEEISEEDDAELYDDSDPEGDANLMTEGVETDENDAELYDVSAPEGDTNLMAIETETGESGSGGQKVVETVENNGITFEITDTGTVTARTTREGNPEPASREGMNSIHPDEYDSSVHDEGHNIAARLGGPAEAYNVHAQDRHLNRAAYKTVENAEVRAAKNGFMVDIEKTAFISNPGSKPDVYMTNDIFTSPDGKSETVHMSFQNATPEEQQEWQDIANQNSAMIDAHENPDPLRASMTPEEYSSLMQETDSELPSIREEMEPTIGISLPSQEVGIGEASVNSVGTSAETSAAAAAEGSIGGLAGASVEGSMDGSSTGGDGTGGDAGEGGDGSDM